MSRKLLKLISPLPFNGYISQSGQFNTTEDAHIDQHDIFSLTTMFHHCHTATACTKLVGMHFHLAWAEVTQSYILGPVNQLTFLNLLSFIHTFLKIVHDQN